MLWDLNEGKHLYTLDGAGDTINALCFSPNRYWLCAATGPSIKIWVSFPVLYLLSLLLLTCAVRYPCLWLWFCLTVQKRAFAFPPIKKTFVTLMPFSLMDAPCAAEWHKKKFNRKAFYQNQILIVNRILGK